MAKGVIKELAVRASVRWAGAVVAVRRGQTRAQPFCFMPYPHEVFKLLLSSFGLGSESFLLC